MKNITKNTLFFLMLCTVISCKRDAEIKNEETEIQFIKESICMGSSKLTPVELDTFKEQQGQIEAQQRANGEFAYFIKINGYAERVYSCKLSENFKKEGMKVLISGTSYTIECNSSDPCPSLLGRPFLIKSIKSL